MAAPAPGWCSRMAGPASEEHGVERCEPVVCCRITSGVLASLIGTLFLWSAANMSSQEDDEDFLVEQCGAEDATGGNYGNHGDADDYYARDAYYYNCGCDDIMPVTANHGGGYGYGGRSSYSDQCQLRFGGDDVERCCADHQNGSEFISLIGVVFSFLSPFLITGGWLGVCGVLGDCKEACASCNRVVTDQPSPCCWRDCTMIWVTPLWLFMLLSMPMHAIKTREWDSNDNAGWLGYTAFLNFVYLIFTVVFAVKPCIPPGHDMASRRARLTGKVVDQVRSQANAVVADSDLQVVSDRLLVISVHLRGHLHLHGRPVLCPDLLRVHGGGQLLARVLRVRGERRGRGQGAGHQRHRIRFLLRQQQRRR